MPLAVNRQYPKRKFDQCTLTLQRDMAGRNIIIDLSILLTPRSKESVVPCAHLVPASPDAGGMRCIIMSIMFCIMSMRISIIC